MARFWFLLFWAIAPQAFAQSPTIDTPNGKLAIFPADNPWNRTVTDYKRHPNSDAFVNSIGVDKPLHPDFGTYWRGKPIGIPYVLVGPKQKKLPITFRYAGESDPGPYPIPLDAPIEGGVNSKGDRHIIVVDYVNQRLYEVFHAFRYGDGWKAGSGAVFDLNSNALRPSGWTSADAAGLPIFPGLIKYDEVIKEKEIRHALRFTVSRSQRGYIYPARHFASPHTSPELPPMGLRMRLKQDVDISGFPAEAQVILVALKKYGMILADNGSDWFISGQPHPKWNMRALASLKKIKGRDFEAIYTGRIQH